MQRYAYRVFYSGGRSSVGHLRLTGAEGAALTGFQIDFPPISPKIRRHSVRRPIEDPNAIHIVIVTTLKMAKVDDAVDSCAESHALSRRGLDHHC